MSTVCASCVIGSTVCAGDLIVSTICARKLIECTICACVVVDHALCTRSVVVRPQRTLCSTSQLDGFLSNPTNMDDDGLNKQVLHIPLSILVGMKHWPMGARAN